jgi:hypothetical protein
VHQGAVGWLRDGKVHDHQHCYGAGRLTLGEDVTPPVKAIPSLEPRGGVVVGEQDRVLVVVAHPDDEALWFTPLLQRATTIVAALPIHASSRVVTTGREIVKASYPVGSFSFLPLSSAGVYRCSDWRRREPTSYGVSLRRKCDPHRAHVYLTNLPLLYEALGEHVRSHDVIFSHNPWGEYGHEEHIQVCRVVTALAKEHGRPLWVWDGFPARSLLADGMRLRSDFYGEATRALPSVELDTDLSLYHEIKRLYQINGAWTGSAVYVPPPTSRYLQIVHEGEELLNPDSPARSRPLRIAARGATLDAPHYVAFHVRRRLGGKQGGW